MAAGTQEFESGLRQLELVGIVRLLLVTSDQEAIDESLNSNISLVLHNRMHQLATHRAAALK